MIEFEKEVHTKEEIQESVFKTIEATIKIMKLGNLPSSEISFEYLDMAITVQIKDELQ